MNSIDEICINIVYLIIHYEILILYLSIVTLFHF